MPKIVLIFILSSLSVFAFAAESPLAVAPGNKKAEELQPAIKELKKIEGLTWGLPKFELQETREELRIFASLDGLFTQEDSNLLYDNQLIKLGPNGEFNFKALLSGPKTTIVVTIIDVLGAVSTQDVEISYPLWQNKWDEFKRYKGKKHFISASTGLSILNYRESFQQNFSQKAITLKLSYNHFIFPPNWELGGTAYYTLASLLSDQPGVGMRFLGVNSRLGYALPFVKLPWRATIMAGFYYTTTFVTGNQFGFENLMGPQIFPVVKRLIGSRDSLGAYFKFSPVGKGFSLLTFSNREVAFGLNLTRSFNRGKSASLSVDLASLDLVIDGIRLISNSASFSIGYGW
ncbi:MAG: hypothetical protein AABZ55_11650 [Bdellovibrionota bacterium]